MQALVDILFPVTSTLKNFRSFYAYTSLQSGKAMEEEEGEKEEQEEQERWWIELEELK